MDNYITLTGEDGEEIEVEVIDQTVVNGINYLLVSDMSDNEDEGDCYILKESLVENDEVEYEVASEEEEDLVFPIFEKQLSGDGIDLLK